YLSVGPTLSRALSERNTAKLSAGYGLYQSLDGLTESRSESLDLALVRQLTEIWSLTASVGYSKSVNSQKVYENFFFGRIFIGEFSSNQDGVIYAATLTRQGQRTQFSAGVAKALQPTGFAFLSRQDSFNLNASYTRSERWDFTAAASWQRALNPVVVGGSA